MLRSMLVLTLLVASAATTARDIQPARESNAVRKKAEDTNLRLPNNTKPSYYKVKIIPYLVHGSFTFVGETNITFNVLELTNDVVLHAKKLTIDRSMTTLTAYGNAIKPKKHKHDNVLDFLTLSFDLPLTPGTYQLSFKFRGDLHIHPHGFYRSSYLNENNDTVWVASTHFLPSNARRTFPCWDEPALKAQFDIAIKHDLKYTALSNMPARKQSTVEEDGMLWTIFETTPNMSTSNIAFAVVDYGYTSSINGFVKVWGPKKSLPHFKYILEISEQAIKIMEQYIRVQLEMLKIDYVALPQTRVQIPASWGLVLCSEDIQYDPSRMRIESNERNIIIVIHKISQMWFGNFVGPSYWNYFWMSEGFAAYFSYILTDRIFPDWKILDTYATTYMDYIFSEDATPAISLNHNVFICNPHEVKNYMHIVNMKASAILRMTMHTVSQTVFQYGVFKYLNEHAYNNVTSDDFSKALQEALDESDVPHEQFTVKQFIDTWENQPGYPIVTVTRNYNTGETQVTQEAFLFYSNYTSKCENSSASWWIPISYATQSNPDFSQTAPKVWMRPQDEVTKIEGVDKHAWIILNVQQTGLYRVNYDETNWLRIAVCLNSENYTDIHVINRANIINDAYSLLLTSDIDPVIFFQLMSYLEREIDINVWEFGAKIIRRVYPFIMAPKQESIFRPRILQMINKIVKHVGIEEKPNDDRRLKKLRPIVRMMACRFMHPDCTIPHDMIPKYIAEIKASKFSWTDQYRGVCTALREAGDVAWQNLLNLYVKNTGSTELLFLSCTNNATLFENFLDLARAKNTPYGKNKFMLMAYFTVDLNPANIEIAVNYFIKNKQELKELIDTSVFQWRIYTNNQFQKLKENFPLNTAEQQKVLNKEEAWINTWEKAVPKIGNWLQSQTSLIN